MAGLEIVNLTLMKQLKENGHDVFCLASGWNNGDFISRLEALAIPFQCVKLGNLYVSRPAWTLASILNLPKAVFQIKSLLKKYSPDIVILNDYRNFLYTGFLWKGYKLIYWEQNLPAINAFQKRTFKSLYQQSFMLVACSDFVRKRLETLTQGRNKIITIHNSIDFPDIEFIAPSYLSGKPVRIGIVGQVIPRKGHLILVDALALLREKDMNCVLYIYGNDKTKYAREVRQAIMEKGLTQLVYWKGFVNDKNQIYNDLDIVVVPSVNEPFGLVAIEPAWWEIPVVAARSGGLPEIIEDRKTGFLFDQGDVRSLVNQLEMLISRPHLRSTMGKQAKNRMLTYFTASQMAAHFIEIFNRPDIFAHKLIK